MIDIVLWSLVCIMGLAICAAFIRVIKGPTISDRLVGVNLIGTFSIAIIIMLSILLKESWLLDVAIVYALLSFLAIVVLTSVFRKGGKND